MKTVLVLLVAIMLAGCAALSTTVTTTSRAQDGTEVVTVTASETDHAVRLRTIAAVNGRERKPICRFTAASGVPVTGLTAFECYGEEKQIDVPAAPPSIVERIVERGFDTLDTGVKVYGGTQVLKAAVNKLGEKGGDTINDRHDSVVNTTDSSDRSTKTVGANSGTNSGNSGNIAEGGSSVDTSTKADRHDTTDRHDSVDNHAVDNRQAVTPAPVAP